MLDPDMDFNELTPLFVARLPSLPNGNPGIQRVLIANRGEIACRIIETCRKLNVTSIAVYVEEDKLSRHVVDADLAICLGSINQAAGNPFLNPDLLVQTALGVKADAIHPGYGYLSENSRFADAVRKAGITFIGPSSDAMSTLGDKRSAKAYLREHEPAVPLIPGFAGSGQDLYELEAAADAIGYPIMLKASAGGGGRGMRIVRKRSDLRDELERARSEAERFFGSSDCILEKYIDVGKHIEIQIIGDSHGNVVSLWERECSVQRRHQKVIEESPSPWLTPEKRQQMSNVAVRIGELLHYENAGTVEFVLDVTDGSFYFLEVNTRLQVEHPITEEVTRVDIVSLQLYVAAGGDLKQVPALQRVPQIGHAIECRLCAEDPQRDFYPEHGTIRLWKPADTGLQSRVRFETAVTTGSEVSIHFDSMIAKIVVWAPTRSLALADMVRVLANTVCAGVRTNQLFLQSCLLYPEFSRPGYTTSFIPANLAELLETPYKEASITLQPVIPLIASFFLNVVGKLNTQRQPPNVFSNVSWGFRSQPYDLINAQHQIALVGSASTGIQPILCTWSVPQETERNELQASVAPLPGANASAKGLSVTQQYSKFSNAVRSGEICGKQHYKLINEGCDYHLARSPVSAPWFHGAFTVTANCEKVSGFLATETTYTGTSGVSQAGGGIRIMCHFPRLGTWIEVMSFSPLSYYESIREHFSGGAEERLKTEVAPMPCKVLSILKKNGESVKAGENVIVVESMKMEMNIAIAGEGTFHAEVREGEAVSEGTILCRVN